MSSDAPPSYITGEDAGRTAARPPAYTASTGLLPKQQPPTAQPHHAEYTRSINNEQRFQGYHTAAAATAAPARQTHPRALYCCIPVSALCLVCMFGCLWCSLFLPWVEVHGHVESGHVGASFSLTTSPWLECESVEGHAQSEYNQVACRVFNAPQCELCGASSEGEGGDDDNEYQCSQISFMYGQLGDESSGVCQGWMQTQYSLAGAIFFCFIALVIRLGVCCVGACWCCSHKCLGVLTFVFSFLAMAATASSVAVWNRKMDSAKNAQFPSWHGAGVDVHAGAEHGVGMQLAIAVIACGCVSVLAEFSVVVMACCRSTTRAYEQL